MLLAIDIGNTNITIGLFKAGALATSRRASTQPRASVDELELLIDGLSPDYLAEPLTPDPLPTKDSGVLRTYLERPMSITS